MINQMTNKIRLGKRYNSDGSISLIAAGRVMVRHRDLSAIEAYIKGWYGDEKPRLNKPIFAPARGSEREFVLTGATFKYLEDEE